MSQNFQAAIPEAEILVFDNNSTDRTAAIALECGVKVIKEPRPGKGYVVSSMFRKVKADYYVLVDGDDTYSAKHVRQLLEPVMEDRADMAVGTRLDEYTDKSFRPLHVFGNNLVRKLVNWIFDNKLTDIMSGYRAYSRELVQTIPILSSGFEVETEMTIRILDYRFRLKKFNCLSRNVRRVLNKNCLLFTTDSEYLQKSPESQKPINLLFFLDLSDLF